MLACLGRHISEVKYTAGILKAPGTNCYAELEGVDSVLHFENPDWGRVGCAVCLVLVIASETGCFSHDLETSEVLFLLKQRKSDLFLGCRAHLAETIAILLSYSGGALRCFSYPLCCRLTHSLCNPQIADCVLPGSCYAQLKAVAWEL